MVFVAGMGKGNYLIPVSVTKYLCHSSMSSKNFNDSGTHKVDFSFCVVASHRRAFFQPAANNRRGV